jgi:Cysteine-rich CPXCG
MEDVARIRCPYCREVVEFYVDPDTQGSFIEDCSVCCRPWLVTAVRDERRRLRISATRAQ